MFYKKKDLPPVTMATGPVSFHLNPKLMKINMKRVLYPSFLVVTLLWVVSACQEENLTPGDDAVGSAAYVGEACGCPPVEDRPLKVLGPAAGGDTYLASTTLSCDTTYALRGRIRMANGAKLTIEPGTIIFGNSPSDKIADRDLIGALIVERTGSIEAPGTCDCPIVMTSRKSRLNRAAGDWGGLLLAGYGAVTVSNGTGQGELEGFLPGEDPVFYGGTGTDAAASTLTYVRVEFSGVDISGGGGDETNSVTMGGLKSTVYTMHHIQASFGGDDSFEWFGGDVDAKYLFSFKTSDDDFDVDQGFAGNVQFGAAWRGPSIANSSGSNGFESDGIMNSSCTLPFGATTTATFSNMTLIGNGNNSVTSPDFFESCVRIREGSAMRLRNSLLGAWPVALKMTDEPTFDNFYAASPSDMFRENLFVSPDDLDLGGCGTIPVEATFRSDFFGAPLHNGYVAAPGRTNAATFLGLDASTALRGACPNLVPVSYKTSVDYSGLSTFFTTTTYRGAFGPSDTGVNGWCTDCGNDDPKWMEFKPESAFYN